jgi:hypothetical protein
MLSGECHNCGEEYKDLRKHWALNSTCEEDPARSSRVEIECAHCGDLHEEWRYRVEKNGRSFCSPQCKSEAQQTGEHIECSWCGSEVYKPDCHISEMGDYSIDNHFCDKTCETQWKRANWTRQDHPSWEGGKGGIDAVRHALSHKSWQSKAREARKRAGNVCENCGAEAQGRDLDVHHIVPVAAGGTNEPWNLMALCIACHRRAEEYIRKYTTPHLYRFAEME